MGIVDKLILFYISNELYFFFGFFCFVFSFFVFHICIGDLIPIPLKSSCVCYSNAERLFVWPLKFPRCDRFLFRLLRMCLHAARRINQWKYKFRRRYEIYDVLIRELVFKMFPFTLTI